MKETELAKHFIKYLSCYDLYFEIPQLNTDIVAKHGNILMAFEVKTAFNFRVIEQALDNTHYFHYSYVCVPQTNKNLAFRICQDYGIGVLMVNVVGDMVWGNVYERVKPRLNRNAHKMKKYVKLPEFSKQSIAGAAGCDGTTITPFKNTVQSIVKYLQRHDGASFKEIFDSVDVHYNSLSATKSCIYKWVNNGVINEFEIKNGNLFLKQQI